MTRGPDVSPPLPGRHIVFVVHALDGGGAESVVRRWARAFSTSGARVTVILTHRKAETAEAHLPDAVAVASLVGRRNLLTRTVGLAALIRKLDPCWVLGVLPDANRMVLLASVLLQGSRTRFAISERNIPLRERSGIALLKEAVTRITYRRAHRFIAISHPVAAYFSHGYGLKDGVVHVVQNPAVPEDTASLSTPRGEAVAGGSEETAVLNVIVPARLVAKKRPFLALAVADVLAERGHAVAVHFFGEGPLRAALTRERRPYRITLHGNVPRWQRHLPAGSVVLLPSEVEGFANVLVEAASVNVPSVACSSALGCADAIVPGVTGYLATSDDAETLADAVLRAAGLDVAPPRAWLQHFSPTASATTLAHALWGPPSSGMPSPASPQRQGADGLPGTSRPRTRRLPFLRPRAQ